ncbi:JAB domain-containing protein [Longimicrobium sp.]|uniref:JAB domain-containing protein n=1 Tax=Longimicrobium sp. TaxID=2029185 RepID=UPI003B3B9D29
MGRGDGGQVSGNGQRPAAREEEAPAVRLAVYRVRLERERYLAFPWRAFGGPEDAVALYRRYAGVLDREHMVAIHLDARGRVSGLHTVSVGSLQRSEAGAREVFKAAILGNAAAIVLVHNHPSGDPSPSPEDVSVAQGLELVGQLVGIPVADHVVVGEPGYASLRDLGLLEFDPHDPDPLRTQNTDEGWAAGLDTLKFGAAFLAGGMTAVRWQARREVKPGGGRAFVPVPARAATLNPMITVEPDPSLRPEEIEPLLEELQRRVGAALERALDGVPATVRVDDVGLSYVREVPVFPVAAGPRVFRDSTEIAEGVEGLAAEAGIGGVVHDAVGRAFRCSAWAAFARLPGEDRPVGDVFTLDDA